MTTTKGNLYTFGCSMTSYNWPTWADILGREFNYYENWGRSGAGNNFIFNSIIECLTKNNLDNNDTMIIMWSGITRIDYYQMNEWTHYHSIFDKKLPVSCPLGAEIISYALFAAIEKILSATKINYSMLRFLDYDTDSKAGQLYKHTIEKIRKIQFPMIEKEVVSTTQHKLEDVYCRHAGVDWPKLEDIFSYDKNMYSADINLEIEDFLQLLQNNKHLYFINTVKDSHPTPLEHLSLLKYISDIKIDKSTINWVEDIDKKIINKQPYSFVKNTPERL